MLRDLVLMRMGRCGDEATVAEARKRFDEHCAGTKTLNADLRTTVSISNQQLIFYVSPSLVLFNLGPITSNLSKKSMTRKWPKDRLQTNPWHREEETQKNSHKTKKVNNKLSLVNFVLFV